MTATVKGLKNGSGVATVTYTEGNCTLTKKVKVIVLDVLSVTISPNGLNICRKEVRGLTATGIPSGGTYSWSINGNATSIYNNQNLVPVFIRGDKGGTATATVTYTLQGSTAAASAQVKVLEISKIVITPDPNGDIPTGTTVTYTVKAYDQDGNDVTNSTSLAWEEVNIPVGCEIDVSKWQTYPKGSGNSITVTWSLQHCGGKPVGNPPYKMKGWVSCHDGCIDKIGSLHVNVVSNK